MFETTCFLTCVFLEGTQIQYIEIIKIPTGTNNLDLETKEKVRKYSLYCHNDGASLVSFYAPAQCVKRDIPNQNFAHF